MCVLDAVSYSLLLSSPLPPHLPFLYITPSSTSLLLLHIFSVYLSALPSAIHSAMACCCSCTISIAVSVSYKSYLNQSERNVRQGNSNFPSGCLVIWIAGPYHAECVGLLRLRSINSAICPWGRSHVCPSIAEVIHHCTNDCL